MNAELEAAILNLVSCFKANKKHSTMPKIINKLKIEMCKMVIESCKNKTVAADFLGISRTAFIELLKAKGLDDLDCKKEIKEPKISASQLKKELMLTEKPLIKIPEWMLKG